MVAKHVLYQVLFTTKPSQKSTQAKLVTLRLDSAVPGVKQRPFTDPCGRMLAEQANANPSR